MARCNSCGSEIIGSPRFCPSCGSSVETKRSDESAAVVSPERSRPKSLKAGVILFLVIFGTGLALYFFFINPSEHPVIKRQPSVASPFEYDSTFVTMTDIQARDEGDNLVFPLDQLTAAKLIRFEYTGGKTDRYVMAYIAPNGKLVTSMSISDHCGSTEFKIKGNEIHCARCPSRWNILTMEAYACCAQYYPDPIPSEVDVAKNEVRIKKEVINKWSGRL